MTGGLADGATPLDQDEAEELIPEHITTRRELNEWEQSNILQAESWLLGKSPDVLTEDFVRLLHRKMFDRTWRWAGEFRRSNKNIGADWPTIPVALRELLADARHWTDRDTYSPREAAVRFHHRLVKIHCFANGNGRHARLCADALLVGLGQPRLSWGAELDNPSDARTTYIAALRAADQGDYAPLLSFAGLE